MNTNIKLNISRKDNVFTIYVSVQVTYIKVHVNSVKNKNKKI